MKFSINTKELLKALNACAKVIQSKNALAILDNVLLSEKDGVYYLTGANSEQRFDSVLSSLIVTEGEFESVCLPCRTLQAALPTLTDELLQIVVKSGKATVKYEAGEFSIAVLDSVEYPVAPALDGEVSEFEMETGKLLDIVKRANTLTANDELRPVMGGVCMDMQIDSLVIVGSDGHRLYKYTMPDVNVGWLKGQTRMAVIPKNLVAALDALRTSESVVVRTDGKQLTFSTDTACVTTRVIEGKYPNYNSVLPPDAPTRVLVNVKQFCQVVKRVSTFASSSNMVVMEVKDSQLRLRAEDIDFSTSSDESLQVVSHNLPEGLRIGFNYVNMLSVISLVPTENALLLITDPSRAIKVKSDEAANDPTVMIQMPMLVQ